MNELLANISARGEPVNIILLIGIAIFAGTVGARIIQKLHIPQIIGYITIGVILGPLLGVISPQTVETLEPSRSPPSLQLLVFVEFVDETVRP